MNPIVNGLSAVQKEHWANATQRNLYKTLTSLDFAEIIDIPNGTIKNLPYVQMQSTTNYTRYQLVDLKQVNSGNDQLILNQTPMVPFNIDDLDIEDDYINILPEVIENGSYKIKERWDGQFFNDAAENGKWKVDANGIGENDGNYTPIQLVSGENQNISETFGNGNALLTQTGCNANKIQLAADSFTKVYLDKLGIQTMSQNVAEESFTRGYRGYFAGMKTYEVSTLTSKTTLNLAVNPTAGDTISIAGVKFTFVSTLANGGDILIGADIAGTIANIEQAINRPKVVASDGTATYTGEGTNYYALNRDSIEGDDNNAAIEGIIGAVAGTGTVEFTSLSGTTLASSKFTDTTNGFGAITVLPIIMEKGATKMTFRKNIRIKTIQVPSTLVEQHLVYARYGIKTPLRGKKRICVIAIQFKPSEIA